MSTAMVPAQRLAQLESVIHKNQQAFIAVGNALAEIRRDRLYKPEYDTFEDYLEQRWHFSRKIASDYILAAGVVSNVNVTDMSLTQARELAGLPPEEQKEIAETTDFRNETTKDVRRKVRSKKSNRNTKTASVEEIKPEDSVLTKTFRGWEKKQAAVRYQDPEVLKEALAGEPDNDVANEMLTKYLQVIANRIAGRRFTNHSVSVSTDWKRFSEGQYVIGPHSRGTRESIGLATLYKIGKHKDGKRLVEQRWDEKSNKWDKERLLTMNSTFYRIITEDVARMLAPEALAMDKKKVA